MMYKLTKDPRTNEVNGVCKDDKYGIPFDPANTDYADFKKVVAEGAELQDADGVKMTAKALKAFIATLP